MDDVDHGVTAGDTTGDDAVGGDVGAQMLLMPTRVQSGASQATKVDRRTLVTELVHTHGDEILGYCIRVLGDRSIAEDVAQQVFLEAYRDIEQARIRSSPKSWLFGIAGNRCIDLLRSRARTVRRLEHDNDAMTEHPDPLPGPVERLASAQMVAALERCLELLSPEVRATVLLRYRSGDTYEEMSSQLAARADALQIRVTRALPVLRRCMESKGWNRE